jgi:hypothetical protein
VSMHKPKSSCSSKLEEPCRHSSKLDLKSYTILSLENFTHSRI